MTSFVQIAHLTSIDCFRTIKYDSRLYAKQQQLSKWRPSPMFANNFLLFALVYFLDAYFKLLRLLAAKACRLNCWLLAKLARNLSNLFILLPILGTGRGKYQCVVWPVWLPLFRSLPPFPNYLWVMLIWLWNECSKGETSKGNVQPEADKTRRAMWTHQHVKY